MSDENQSNLETDAAANGDCRSRGILDDLMARAGIPPIPEGEAEAWAALTVDVAVWISKSANTQREGRADTAAPNPIESHE